MVQPLPHVVLSGRPDAIMPRPGHRLITNCKYDEFRAILGKISERQPNARDGLGPPETTGPRTSLPETEGPAAWLTQGGELVALGTTTGELKVVRGFNSEV